MREMYVALLFLLMNEAGWDAMRQIKSTTMKIISFRQVVKMKGIIK